ncbi:MAG: substrate-binding domain-containing protein [Anaerolineae bacterium]|nr:substrate-binding domain-containing protein [Anaerolineae bacterium]
MSSLQRRVGMLILITLVIHPLLVFGQGEISVVGSGIPAPLIQAFASEAGVSINLNVTGTNDGFAALCAGEADITSATRTITATEENNCNENSVSFLEFVVGYDIMAVVANPASDFGQCLTSSQLDTIFAPSSTVTKWNEVSVENADVPLSLYVPTDNTTPYALLDSVVEGVGLRGDLNTLDSDSAIIDAVAAADGALGVVRLPAALAAGETVKILDLSTTTAGCASPSVENAIGRTYQAAYPFYVYVNSAALEATQPLIAAAVGADAAATVAAQGFVAPTEAIYSTDSSILANVTTGRQFSKDVTEFSIPTNLVGLIAISGAATGSDYLTAVTGAFVQQNPGVTLNQTFAGEPDGIRQLCNGEVDVITAFNPLDADQQNNCAANNIPTETIHLGGEAVVLVGNGDFMTCLTTGEIASVWSAASAGTITNWNQVNASFPDLPISLLGLPNSDSTGDVLMLLASGQNVPTREDLAESRTSPAYRVTAVGNVEGGITYMNWLDYQSLAADVQANAQLLAVDASGGCVMPSATSINDVT